MKYFSFTHDPILTTPLRSVTGAPREMFGNNLGELGKAGKEEGLMKYFTATFQGGTPYYPTDGPFATLAELRRDIADIDIGIIGDPHEVVLGSVEQDREPHGPADVDWSTWEAIETVWAGDIEGD